MTDRSNMYTCSIRLFGPIDGLEIEDFIAEKQLRSQDNDVYTSDHSGKFRGGTSYVTICVAAISAVSATANANQIAEHFGGDLI
jgi:hypothetical protein